MISFPSIEQLKDIAAAKGRGSVNFTGTIKLHGSNAAVVFDLETEKLTCQSRNRILTIEKDNANFAKFVESNADVLVKLCKEAAAKCAVASEPDTDSASKVSRVCVYGEWCGNGIQKGVGICQLPRMFVFFDAIAIMENKENLWLAERLIRQVEAYPDRQIYSIYSFPNFRVTIDFKNPRAVTADLDKYTFDVEKECPVAAALGVPNGVGEGIVWKEETDQLLQFYKTEPLRFKTKGELHRHGGVDSAAQSKPASLDQAVIETIEKFVAYAASESRMLQGIDYLREMGLDCSQKNLGTFIGWCSRDIIKEETKTMQANGLLWKNVEKGVKAKLIKFYASQFA
jgi:hypothetical protein